MVHEGLEGVVAAATSLSHVDGERGELIIGGFPVGELAAKASFEETIWLLWHGRLPNRHQLAAFREELASARELPRATVALIAECARRSIDPMDALRIATGTLSLDQPGPAAIVATIPTIVAAFWRMGRGEQPVAP